ncbi:MAG: glycoside hydrolase family 88 protein [Candidatus Cryptobacteroides sp.]
MRIILSRSARAAALTLLSLLLCVPAYSSRRNRIGKLAERVFETASVQAKLMASNLDSASLPKSIAPDGSFRTSVWHDWISGFYPGTLWYIYKYSGDPEIAGLAVVQTEKCSRVQYVKTNHDVGFMINSSYGNGFRIGGIDEYAGVLRNAAHSLVTRYNPLVGCIKSWEDNPSRGWYYPVIIDNMMNLELLVRVAGLFDEPNLLAVALSHADVTMKNHFREDGSTFHVVNYDPETGRPLRGETAQGYSDESTWARGQAWALYGYTMMADLTGEERYLRKAEELALWTIRNLPEDYVQYWDYTAAAKLLADEAGLDRRWAGELPDGRILRDASSAAITASAFACLARISRDRKLAGLCRETALRQVEALSSPEYMAEPGTNCGFILKHSTGAYHGNSEVDVPLTYADYYFLEAILRLLGEIE